MENKKSILVVILVVVVVAISGFVVYTKLGADGKETFIISKDSKVSNNSTQKAIVKREELKELMRIVDAIPEFNKNTTVDDFKTLSLEEKVHFAAELADINMGGVKVKETLNKYLGSDLGIKTMDDLKCKSGKVYMKYNGTQYDYTENCSEENMDTIEAYYKNRALNGLKVVNYFYSYEREENKIKLNVQKIFTTKKEIEDSNYQYDYIAHFYTNYDDAVNRKNMDSLGDTGPSLTYDSVNQYYTYNFEKSGDTYKFINYTINKF